VRRLLLLLGVAGLLAGTAAGTWLLGQCPPRTALLPLSEPVWGASSGLALVSFRISRVNSLLEARLEAHPGWLLVCHGPWHPSLGTRLCRQLGYLRSSQQKGVKLADVPVGAGQQFLQVTAGQEGQLRAPAWQVFAGIVTQGWLKPEAGVPVRDIFLHPLYNESSLDYDMALMRLRVPLNFSGQSPGSVPVLPGSARCCPVSSRGVFSRGKLHPCPSAEALVPLIGTRRCNSSCGYRGELTARMLCAGHLQGRVDACQGDSGGPLVCWDGSMWRLVGIVSWGRGCAEPNHPGVYTNVAQLLPWIHQVTQDRLLPTLCNPNRLPDVLSINSLLKKIANYNSVNNQQERSVFQNRCFLDDCV
uniref:Transmembrane serine protease 5 n=1 Tax=Cyanistes caeruleus TaxID=156563 RepID=A0A8C0U512_CYACU